MKRLLAPVFALTFLLAGCASTGPSYPPEIRQGRIEQITEVPLDHPHQIGVGAILGGAAGAGIGSLIGGGTGKDVAIAVGAIAGAIGGQYAEKKYESKKAGQQIVVRLNSGVLVVITQAADPSLRVGQRVYVQGAGAEAKLIPQ